VSASSHDVTKLLRAWAAGNLDARDELLGLLQHELRRRAAARLRHERAGHILQPTALVHEAYLRLIGDKQASWQNRAHFLAVASEIMRRVLVDHARARKMAKRSGGWARVTLDEAVAPYDPRDVDVLDLDIALSELAGFDQRKSRVAELRFFGGLSLEEIAHIQRISRATVEREWQAARAWLYRRVTARTSRGVT
jgi:RNA polymerase sigma-70 factor (ECF subfamily)